MYVRTGWQEKLRRWLWRVSGHGALTFPPGLDVEAMTLKQWRTEVDRLIAAEFPGKKSSDLAVYDARSMWRSGTAPEDWARALAAQVRKDPAGH